MDRVDWCESHLIALLLRYVDGSVVSGWIVDPAIFLEQIQSADLLYGETVLARSMRAERIAAEKAAAELAAIAEVKGKECRCEKCGFLFPSKNKLFKHLKQAIPCDEKLFKLDAVDVAPLPPAVKDIDLGSMTKLRPLSRSIASSLVGWWLANDNPRGSIYDACPCMKSLVAHDHVEYCNLLTAFVMETFDFTSKTTVGHCEHFMLALHSLLECFQWRGLRTLLGMVQTAGSIDCLPPPLSVMYQSFNEVYKEPSCLSTGARALTKHCHRDSSSWWGSGEGLNDEGKNEWASGVLERLLASAVWVNCHQLPHEEAILEIRNQLGYGARWSVDGKFFRGFLEPQVEGGHEIGWRH